MAALLVIFHHCAVAAVITIVAAVWIFWIAAFFIICYNVSVFTALLIDFMFHVLATKFISCLAASRIFWVAAFFALGHDLLITAVRVTCLAASVVKYWTAEVIFVYRSAITLRRVVVDDDGADH